MKITYKGSCYNCDSPLKISFFTNGQDTDLLYTWALREPLDLSLNIQYYKRVGSKIKRSCASCYNIYYDPQTHLDREVGKKWRKNPQKSLSKADILYWIRRGMVFVRNSPPVIQAPLALTAAYWLIIPGLYLWYRPIVLPTFLTEYEDSDIQVNW